MSEKWAETELSGLLLAGVRIRPDLAAILSAAQKAQFDRDVRQRVDALLKRRENLFTVLRPRNGEVVLRSRCNVSLVRMAFELFRARLAEESGFEHEDIEVSAVVHCGGWPDGAQIESNGYQPPVAINALRLLEASRSRQLLVSGRVFDDIRQLLTTEALDANHPEEVAVQWQSEGMLYQFEGHVPITAFQLRERSPTDWKRLGPIRGLDERERLPGMDRVVRAYRELEKMRRRFDKVFDHDGEFVNLAHGPKQIAAALLDYVQAIIERFADGKVLCSIKLENPRTRRLECVYPSDAVDLVSRMAPVDRAIQQSKGLPRTKSYSGLAYKKDEPIFVPDLSQPPRGIRVDWPPAVEEAVRNAGITGLITHQIPGVFTDGRKTAAVLKIDMFEANALTESDPTRIVLSMLTLYLGNMLMRTANVVAKAARSSTPVPSAAK